jgi:uncharacterized protein YqjF (DUF2071 family)
MSLDRDLGEPGATDIDDHPFLCPTPVRRPVMVQQWTDVVFLHWAYDPDVVQRLLPAGMTVDLHDGAAWVGLVPFHMNGLGFPGMAPLPHVGSFPEINVRTYVRAQGRVGVYFFSLDVDRYLPAVTARATYSLPYCAGAASHGRAGDVLTSSVRRRWPRPTGRADTEVAVRTAEQIDATAPFPRFLTGRWGLVSAGRRGGLRWAPVDHEPWRLHTAQVLHLDDHLVAAAGLPQPVGDPHVMWSPGVDVRIGRPVAMR